MNGFDATHIDNWMNLASKICETGIKEKDTVFLRSYWYRYLRDSVIEWRNLRNTGDVRHLSLR